MTPQTTIQAGWDEAPALVEGARTTEATPADCNLDYWIREVTQGTWSGLVHGHRPESEVPAFMVEPGPLRDALVDEFAFRSISEEKATRAIASLVANAPDVLGMEFFATQMLDEARHSRIFRDHLVELGVPEADLLATIERIAGRDRDRILVPLEEFAQPVIDAGDYAAGAVILTVLVEGILAPLAELSERKWRPLNPAAADIERGASIDEIRHLTVGSAVVRQHVLEHPDEAERLAALIREGRALWTSLPTAEVIYARELLYQAGIEQHSEIVGDYELAPGLRLLDTSPEQRLTMALEWSLDMQDSRLAYMGLHAALD